MSRVVIFWFRNDLRLFDNPALHAAASLGRPVLPVFILDPEHGGDWRPGAASRWWLHHSLAALQGSLGEAGGRLRLEKGPADEVLPRLVEEVGAGAVCWNRRYEPWAIDLDGAIKTRLKGGGIDVRSFNGALIHEPWEVTQKTGNEPYRVFTPYSRTWFDLDWQDPPGALPATDWAMVEGGCDLDDLDLLPRGKDWASGLRATWTPGEAAARSRAVAFIEDGLHGYRTRRDFPAEAGTSRLSPHLHWGELSVARLRRSIEAAVLMGRLEASRADAFVRQLCWRDFAHHCLYHEQALADEPVRGEFKDYPWSDDATALAAWQKGRTGYPIVDAGMRELWHTGTMHNRVRMITGSFLTKHLRIPWQEGERWFWDTLCDADLANNAMGWQWVAGCGIDAAPYFRIFNPMTQAEKFDKKGHYVRRWVPELAGLPDTLIHRPWDADAPTLKRAGVDLGRTYPRPIVDHMEAREAALAGWRSMRGAGP